MLIISQDRCRVYDRKDLSGFSLEPKIGASAWSVMANSISMNADVWLGDYMTKDRAEKAMKALYERVALMDMMKQSISEPLSEGVSSRIISNSVFFMLDR